MDSYKSLTCAHLHKLLIFIDRFLYDALEIRRKALLCLFVKLLWIDGLPIFQNDMCLFNARKLVLKYGSGIVHADGHDGTAALFRDLERTCVEGKETQLLAVVACPLREYADGDAVFYIIDCPKDRLKPFLHIVPAQKQAVEPFHPGAQYGIS